MLRLAIQSTSGADAFSGQRTVTSAFFSFFLRVCVFFVDTALEILEKFLSAVRTTK
jgi:hypothetical protein